MKIKKVNIHLSPKDLHEFLTSNDNWVLSLDENCSSGEIRALFEKHISSRFCSELIIESIAEHPNTPIDILELLSEKKDLNILDSLSINPKINTKIIDHIMQTGDYVVLEHLVHNPSFPRKKLFDLLDIIDDEDLRQVIRSIIDNRKDIGD